MRLFLEREIELERQMDHMLKLIDLSFGEPTALELEQQLQRLLGLWRACLVLRDHMVYGPAKTGSDPSRALMADACQQRMDILADEVEDYARSWSSSALISTATPRFRATMAVLIAGIAARLDGERRLLGERDYGPAARMVA
ncbi:MAG: hypothetical protein ACR2FK_05165 [Sphingomicrobium sp.]